MRNVFIGLAALLVLVVLLLPIILVFLIPFPAGYTWLTAFRDAAIIYASFFMCVGALLFIVMTALIALIAFTLRDKVTPVMEKVDDTVKTVRGTTTFVSESVVAPIIKAAGAAAGARAMVQSLMRRNPGGRKGKGAGAAPDTDKEKEKEKA